MHAHKYMHIKSQQRQCITPPPSVSISSTNQDKPPPHPSANILIHLRSSTLARARVATHFLRNSQLEANELLYLAPPQLNGLGRSVNVLPLPSLSLQPSVAINDSTHTQLLGCYLPVWCFCSVCAKGTPVVAQGFCSETDGVVGGL